MHRRMWPLVAFLTSIPLTAIFHNVFFYRPTCMLNPFGADYYPAVLKVWLRSDPSPWLGMIVAVLIYVAGRFVTEVRLWSLAFFIAFLPVSIWIWDIPFTGRMVCRLFHDGASFLHTRHLYVLGAVLWVAIVAAFHSARPGSAAIRRWIGSEG